VTDEPYLRQIEWECCDEPITLGVSQPIDGLPPGVESITFRRDDQYRLIAEIAGAADAEAYGAYHQMLRDQVPGTSGPDRLDVNIEHLTGRAAVRLSIGGRGGPLEFEENRVRWTIERQAYSLRLGRLDRLDPPPAWHTDWYLNGPRRFLFDRPTNHSFSTKYTRDRGDGRRVDLIGPGGPSGRLDHIVVNTLDVTFVVHQVPEDFGPQWSKNVGIEYGWGGSPIPNENVRDAIGEIVGFAIGRRLLRIGSTEFDETGRPVAREGLSPWGDENRSICESPDDSPFRMDGSLEGSTRLEDILVDLVPKYLRGRGPYSMKDALEDFWIARVAPIEIDLPIFSAAVECLKSAWFRAPRTKTKGVFLEKAKFDRLLADTFERAREALNGEPFGEAIVAKMKRSNEMGANEGLRTFFVELGVKIGAQEQAAIRARNSPAHGGSAASDDELGAMHAHGRTYQILFERVFLRVLGYDGQYVDRATAGFPLRNLEEPVGGQNETVPL
jgi:hypothetical protein